MRAIVANSGFEETVLEWISFFAIGIEVLAVDIIVVAIASATIRYTFRSSLRPPDSDNYEQYKQQLGKSMLLCLEILVAADIVRTVALEPTLENVAVLGLLVLIRTFLSWSLVVEIEGYWPWQSERTGNKGKQI